MAVQMDLFWHLILLQCEIVGRFQRCSEFRVLGSLGSSKPQAAFIGLLMSNRGSCFAWSFSQLTSITSTAISTMLAGGPDVTTWSTRPNTLGGNLTRSSKSLLKWRFMRLPFSELLSHRTVADLLCYVCRTTSFDKCKRVKLVAAHLAQGYIRQG